MKLFGKHLCVVRIDFGENGLLLKATESHRNSYTHTWLTLLLFSNRRTASSYEIGAPKLKLLRKSLCAVRFILGETRSRFKVNESHRNSYRTAQLALLRFFFTAEPISLQEGETDSLAVGEISPCSKNRFREALASF